MAIDRANFETTILSSAEGTADFWTEDYGVKFGGPGEYLDDWGFLWEIRASKKVNPPPEKQVPVGKSPPHSSLKKYYGQWYFGKCYRPLNWKPPNRVKSEPSEKKYIWAACVLKGDYGVPTRPYMIQDEVDHRISDVFYCEPCDLVGSFLDSLFSTPVEHTDDFTVNFAELKSGQKLPVVLKLVGRVLFVQSVNRLIQLLQLADKKPSDNGDLDAWKHRTYWWKCSCGHEYQGKIGTVCPNCAYPRENDGPSPKAIRYADLPGNQK